MSTGRVGACRGSRACHRRDSRVSVLAKGHDCILVKTKSLESHCLIDTSHSCVDNLLYYRGMAVKLLLFFPYSWQYRKQTFKNCLLLFQVRL